MANFSNSHHTSSSHPLLNCLGTVYCQFNNEAGAEDGANCYCPNFMQEKIDILFQEVQADNI